VAVPFFDMNTNKFKTALPVVMKTLDKNAVVYNSVEEKNKKPSGYICYTRPFTVTNTCNVNFYAVKKA
jgi:hypothetical protein